jgi:hypothetical protein
MAKEMKLSAAIWSTKMDNKKGYIWEENWYKKYG